MWVNVFQEQIIMKHVSISNTWKAFYTSNHMLHRNFDLCWEATAWQKGKRNIKQLMTELPVEIIQLLDLQPWLHYFILIQQIFIKYLHDQKLL